VFVAGLVRTGTGTYQQDISTRSSETGAFVVDYMYIGRWLKD